MNGEAVRVAGIRELIRPKWVMTRRRLGGEGSELRAVVLGLVGVVFWAILFGIIYRMLLYFKAAAGIGDVLALKLLGLILLAFLSVLLLSNIITALTSFFWRATSSCLRPRRWTGSRCILRG